jgi:hypothetical protein
MPLDFIFNSAWIFTFLFTIYFLHVKVNILGWGSIYPGVYPFADNGCARSNSFSWFFHHCNAMVKIRGWFPLLIIRCNIHWSSTNNEYLTLTHIYIKMHQARWLVDACGSHWYIYIFKCQRVPMVTVGVYSPNLSKNLAKLVHTSIDVACAFCEG